MKFGKLCNSGFKFGVNSLAQFAISTLSALVVNVVVEASRDLYRTAKAAKEGKRYSEVAEENLQPLDVPYGIE